MAALERTEEWLVLLKLPADRYDELAAFLTERHSYDEPEIIALPILAGSTAYLTWMRDETRLPPGRLMPSGPGYGEGGTFQDEMTGTACSVPSVPTVPGVQLEQPPVRRGRAAGSRRSARAAHARGIPARRRRRPAAGRPGRAAGRPGGPPARWSRRGAARHRGSRRRATGTSRAWSPGSVPWSAPRSRPWRSPISRQVGIGLVCYSRLSKAAVVTARRAGLVKTATMSAAGEHRSQRRGGRLTPRGERDVGPPGALPGEAPLGLAVPEHDQVAHVAGAFITI